MHYFNLKTNKWFRQIIFETMNIPVVSAWRRSFIKNVSLLVTIVTVISFVTILTQCRPLKKVSNEQVEYDFTQPMRTMALPSELREISGLDYDSASKSLYAVADERGILYKIDPQSGLIRDRVKIGKDGDYEGVEVVGSYGYTIKSNGKIHQCDLRANIVKEIKTPFNSKNDVEGLAYSEKIKGLIIACKGVPLKPLDKGSKAIYHFDLTTEKVIQEPLCVFDFKDIVSANKRMKNWPLNELLLGRIKEFAPSAIAFSAVTGDCYILSSRGKMLLIVSSNWRIDNVVFLDSALFRQPEGICFDEHGNIYISSEAKGRNAKILVFSPQESI